MASDEDGAIANLTFWQQVRSGEPMSDSNMRKLSMAVLLVAMAMTSQRLSAAKPPVTYAPSISWNVDYAADSCALRRAFANADKKVLLELRQFAPGDRFSMTVASTSFPSSPGIYKVRFAPDPQPHEADHALSLGYQNGQHGFVWNDGFMPTTKIDDPLTVVSTGEQSRDSREMAIEGIELSGSVAPPVFLATGEMKRPMDAMRKCTDELLTHWGIDAATQRTLTRPVRPTGQVKWARIIQAEYPSAMLQQMKGGIVHVRMIVGPDGRAQSCHIQVPSQDPSFEKTACAGMMKASRFDPALDAAGKPTTSYFVTGINYIVN